VHADEIVALTERGDAEHDGFADERRRAVQPGGDRRARQQQRDPPDAALGISSACTCG
jgi:hypothetical protein